MKFSPRIQMHTTDGGLFTEKSRTVQKLYLQDVLLQRSTGKGAQNVQNTKKKDE